MITKKEKEQLVADIAQKIKNSLSVLLVDFTGLKVVETSKLRQDLFKQGIEMKVAKKTLIQRAFISAEIKGADAYQFPGSIGLIFSPEQGSLVSKSIYDFAKTKAKDKKFQILGGLVFGEFVLAEKIIALAKLPSKEILLGQLLFVLNSLPQALVGVLGGLNRKFVSVLDQISKK